MPAVKARLLTHQELCACDQAYSDIHYLSSSFCTRIIDAPMVVPKIRCYPTKYFQTCIYQDNRINEYCIYKQFLLHSPIVSCKSHPTQFSPQLSLSQFLEKQHTIKKWPVDTCAFAKENQDWTRERRAKYFFSSLTP